MKIMLEVGALMPTRTHETDAGYDLYAPMGGIVPAHGSAVINTGVHFGMDEGMFGTVTHRSGINFKAGVIVPNGTIDSGYTGAVKVKLYNLTDRSFVYASGDRIAQIVFTRYESPNFDVVDELDSTDRGDTGIGDSGK